MSKPRQDRDNEPSRSCIDCIGHRTPGWRGARFARPGGTRAAETPVVKDFTPASAGIIESFPVESKKGACSRLHRALHREGMRWKSMSYRVVHRSKARRARAAICTVPCTGKACTGMRCQRDSSHTAVTPRRNWLMSLSLFN